MSRRRRDVVVVGAGHNGLVAACYLAREGYDVEVVDGDTVAGGAVSTVERWPGVRVDRGSSIHVMVRHTGIVEDLRLAELGLVYDDVEPWGVLPHRDGGLRFSTSLDETSASIESVCGSRDADAYRRFIKAWTPRMRAFLAAAHRPPTVTALGRAFWPLARRRTPSWATVAREFLAPAETVLGEAFRDDRLKAALGWWAAQSGPPPHEVGTAAMAGTVAMLHLRAAGRPRGGSGRLSEALAGRLASYGGVLRLGDAAVAIATGDRPAIVTATGERIECRSVLAACHAVDTTRLVGRPDLARRVRTGRGVGVMVRLLTDALPSYPVSPSGAHTSMQLLVESTNQLRAAYGDFLRGEPPQRPPLLVMTPTATDVTLAPAGRHVVSVWAQWYPARLATGDWDGRRDEVADSIVAALDRWAPGTAGSVIERWVQTPPDLERELGLYAGNVMHVEPGLDAMFSLRPLPGWSAYRSPLPGLYLCGASTHPGGGVWGASGRSAAAVVSADLSSRRSRSPIGHLPHATRRSRRR